MILIKRDHLAKSQNAKKKKQQQKVCTTNLVIFPYKVEVHGGV